MTAPGWLSVTRGSAPLLVSLPHTGTAIPADLESGFVSLPLARKDADWHVERLYDFAAMLDATIIHTAISRSVIDVNRDPSGASLYPGQTTTGLCPVETFDGEPLYQPGHAPDDSEIDRRCQTYFAPYHAAMQTEIDRLRRLHPRIALYDCHSIRSAVPRLFDGILPQINIGTNSGASCAPDMQKLVEAVCIASDFSHVSNGRFRGGWITRHYGAPERGVHAVQIELACRSYLRETPGPVSLETWPPAYDPDYAAPLRRLLVGLLTGLRDWAGLERIEQ